MLGGALNMNRSKKCPKCGSEAIRDGVATEGRKEYPVIICTDCGYWG
jgi:predicted nucleic-acid-binding Zn-ribbon protein